MPAFGCRVSAPTSCDRTGVRPSSRAAPLLSTPRPTSRAARSKNRRGPFTSRCGRTTSRRSGVRSRSETRHRRTYALGTRWQAIAQTHGPGSGVPPAPRHPQRRRAGRRAHVQPMPDQKCRRGQTCGGRPVPHGSRGPGHRGGDTSTLQSIGDGPRIRRPSVRGGDRAPTPGRI